MRCQARRTDPRVLSSRRRRGIQICVRDGRDLGSRACIGCDGRSHVVFGVGSQESTLRIESMQHTGSTPRTESTQRAGFLSGARPALPMGVAPEAMFGCLQSSIGSNCLGVKRCCHPRRYSAQVMDVNRCRRDESERVDVDDAAPKGRVVVETKGGRGGRCRRVTRAPSPHASAEKEKNVQLH